MAAHLFDMTYPSVETVRLILAKARGFSAI
jgi:hypothetical protein